MKNIFKPGDTKVYRMIVAESDLAAFQGELLHAVCSTFALARDFEWSSRLFFIELKEADEEGVGTFVEVNHKSPAFLEEEITITATVDKIEGMNMVCLIEARVKDRLIAAGRTGQRMLKRERLAAIFTKPATGDQ